MPVQGFLGQEQQKKLQKTLKEHEHPEIRERILILLLLNEAIAASCWLRNTTCAINLSFSFCSC